jgi:pimeloyl-ACP methyl ester carboxylesterase
VRSAGNADEPLSEFKGASVMIKVITPNSGQPGNLTLWPVPAPQGRNGESASVETGVAEFKWRHRCAELACQIYQEGKQENLRNDPLQSGNFTDQSRNLFAAARIEDGEAIIAFRGTVGSFLLSTNWRKVNLCAEWTALEPARHRGFWDAWEVLRPQVEQWLRTNQPKSINITGHSMGAALAQLAAFTLCENWPIARIVLFATPMIGAAAFNDAYAKKTIRDGTTGLNEITFRYLMLTDAISLPLPRVRGYRPGSPLHVIDQYGRKVDYLPGFLGQIMSQTMLQPSPLANYPKFSRLPEHSPFERPGDDLGESQFERQAISNMRLTAQAMGLWGWWALLGMAVVLVLRKAVGFHNMNGYVTALRGQLVRATNPATKPMAASGGKPPVTINAPTAAPSRDHSSPSR